MKIALLCTSLLVAVSSVAQAQVRAEAISKRITIKAPVVFAGTLEDNKDTPIAEKYIVLRSLDKNAPLSYQMIATDSKGGFHFDSVPAGEYDMEINFSGWAVKKTKVHCAANNSCIVTLIVTPASPSDWIYPKYDLERNKNSVIR